MAESEKSTQEHKGWPKGKRRYGVTRSQQHGLHRLRETYDKLGSRAIDPSSEVGKVLAEWKAGLVQDLGGEENLSTQQLALVDVCVRDRLLLESIDAWLFGQPKLINSKRKTVYPAVLERMRVASGFQQRLQALGLERRAKPVPPIKRYLAERAAAHQAAQNGAGAGPAAEEADPEVIDVEGGEPVS